ncbi:hypothetical protein ABFS83_04G139500 [Erythranthe nasuta]
MSSACTVPRLVRCRVRDLASCFFACRLPLEEEPETSRSKGSTKGRIIDESIGRHKKKSTIRDEISIVANKNCKEEENDDVIIRGESILQSSSQNDIAVKSEDGSMAEPRFAEEDYIVFCFRDDGEIHMVNEAHAAMSSSSSPLDNDDDNQHASTTTAASNSLRTIMITKGEWPPNEDEDEDKDENEEIKEMKKKKNSSNVDEEQPNGSKMESFESCDSNLSDTSTTSFAFPVLGIEWIGSPVHMPKSEKHDGPQSVRLHCCRF